MNKYCGGTGDKGKEGRGKKEAGLGRKSKLRPHTRTHTHALAHKHPEMIPKATGSGPGYEVHNITTAPDTEINTERVIHKLTHTRKGHAGVEKARAERNRVYRCSFN